MESIEELNQDCQELQTLLKIATRSNVRQLIASEITLLQGKLHKLQEEHKKEGNEKTEGASNGEQAPKEEKPQTKHVFTKKIESYGWDQTEKTIKIYISLKGVENVPRENIKLESKKDSFDLLIRNLDEKNHNLNIKNLLELVDPAGSSYKAKSGNIIVTLKKKVPKNWEHLTGGGKKASDADVKAPSLDNKEEDPSAGIMKMMKQMYDDGDDEMKRTITKAWTESREKQGPGGLGPGNLGL